MAVIELDLDAPPAASRPPARRYRPFGLVAVCLLLALGGAAPPRSVLLQRLGVVPLIAADTGYTMAGDTLYTVAVTDDGRVTSAWRGSPPRREWSLPEPSAPDRPPSAGVAQRYGVVLLDGRPGSTVIDAATGAVRWSSPSTVQVLGPRTGVVARTTFRAGTEYDQESGDPGQLFWSDAGRPYTRPALRTELRGVDLATGRQRWSVTEPGSIFAVPADGGANALIVVSAGRLSVRDGDTGAVRAQRALPRAPAGDVAFAQVVGDVLLIRSGAWDLGGLVAAYAADTLEPLWRMTEPANAGEGGICAALICRPMTGGLAVIDPRTGTPAWRVGRNADLLSLGWTVLEVTTDSGRPVRLHDARTGRVRAELSAWSGVAAAFAGQPLILTRFERDSGVTAFGILDPGTTVVRPLGRADAMVRECAANAELIACRVSGGIGLWSYGS